MVKTVKEIAIDLEVTIQTVYNHIKKNNRELKGCISKQQGMTLIDDAGIRIIKESMGLLQPATVKEDISMESIINDISASVSANLKESISEQVSANIKKDYEVLEQQIQELKEQNKLLIEMMKEQQERKSIFNWFRKHG